MRARLVLLYMLCAQKKVVLSHAFFLLSKQFFVERTFILSHPSVYGWFLLQRNEAMRFKKHELRKQVLARRDAILASDRTQRSQVLAAYANVLCLTGETVSAFWPIRSEIDPYPLMSALVFQGNRLALPVITKKNTMIFRLFKGSDKLVDLPFGLKGPNTSAEIVHPTTIFLPLAAFDNHGNRIGYGSGYYDKTVDNIYKYGHNPRLIALAFDCQQVECIPAEAHDIPLQGVLTESGFKIFH
ncbi:MAG: 5-formyltetrahydrofolate cyclo-ligase [Candidatus Tokpelaia sp. JSC085]|nr:MAG: 5-formyltetrahydrofolate cyclo-ligase [Candidatus Tokpelaia sp. JSC085]